MAADSDVTARFALDVEADASGAVGAADQLETLRQKIDNGMRSLREMKKAQKALNQGSSINIATFKELEGKISAQKEAVARAQQSYLELGGTFARNRKPSKEVSGGLRDLARHATSLPGPLGRAAGSLGSLTSKLGLTSKLVGGAVIAGGILAIAAALLALGAAAVKAASALATYAIKQADARRSELLRLEGLTKVRRFMIGGVFGEVGGNAGFIQKEIDRVSQMVALGRDEIAGMATELAGIGLKGGNLQAALEGMAITAATQGKRWAQQFKHMALTAGLTGQSIRALADDAKARLGGIAKRQLLSLDVQLRKLKENLSLLFEGVRLDGFLLGMSKITELFSQSTASGRALKKIIDVAFKPLGALFERLAPIGKRFFQGMVIGALLLTIGILRLRRWFKKTFGDSEILKGIDLQKAALVAGVIVVASLTAALAGAAIVAGILAVAFAVVGAAITVGLGLFAALVVALTALGVAVVSGAIAGFNWLKNVLKETWTLISDLSWGELGEAIVNGIAIGIKDGAKWVIDALKNLAASGWQAFKDKILMRSPSKLFQMGGLQIPKGEAKGIREGTPEVHKAIEDMTPSPGKTSSPSVAGRSGSPVTISFGELHVHAESSDPEELADAVRRVLTSSLQGVAIELGAERVTV